MTAYLGMYVRMYAFVNQRRASTLAENLSMGCDKRLVIRFLGPVQFGSVRFEVR